MTVGTVVEDNTAYLSPADASELRARLQAALTRYRMAPRVHAVAGPSPNSVAAVLLEWRVPRPLVEVGMWSAALYHATYHELSQELDASRAHLAYLVTKFDRLLKETRDQQRFPDLYQTLLGEFWPVEFVVLVVAFFVADLRHIATNGTLEERQSMASLVRLVFEPVVSKRLGMWNLHRDLLDLALQAENPAEFARAQTFTRELPGLQPLIDRVKQAVQRAADAYKVPLIELMSEEARPYKVSRLRQSKSRVKSADVVSFTIVTDTERSCYACLGALHSIGQPLAAMRDYIATPKGNGYRALHTKVAIAPLGTIQFLVRSAAMAIESDYGILAHWWQGPHPKFDQTYLESHLFPPRQGAQHYMYIFTNKGIAYSLPDASTPVDLAYAVGVRQGDQFSHAVINGSVEAGGNHRLEHGDIVELVRGLHRGPNKQWLATVQTEHARNLIESWEARASTRPLARVPEKPVSTDLAPDVAAAVLLPEEWMGSNARLCDRCKPYPPQPIHMYVTHDGVITIHQRDCPAVPDRAEAEPLRWRRSSEPPAEAMILIDTWDRIGLLQAVTEQISPHVINISRIEVTTSTNRTAHFEISLPVQDPVILAELKRNIARVASVVAVRITTRGRESGTSDGVRSPTGRLLNPYSPQPASDPSIFFGRAEEQRHIWDTLEGWSGPNSVLLSGQQRIGKTSILNQLARTLREEPHPRFVALQLSTLQMTFGDDSDPGRLIKWLTQRLARGLQQAITRGELPRIEVDVPTMPGFPIDELQTYLDHVAAQLGSVRLLVLFDELQQVLMPARTDTAVLIEGLNHLLEMRRDIAFVFAYSGVQMSTAATLLAPLQARAITVSLRPLDASAARDLIRKPAQPFVYEEPVVDRLCQITGCHPYYLHLLCRDLLEHVNDQGRTNVTEADYADIIERALQWTPAPFVHLLSAVPGAQEVLVSVVRLSREKDECWVSQSAVLAAVSAITAPDMRQTLTSLVEYGVLERRESEDHQDRQVRLSIPIVHAWIARNLV